MLNINFIVYSLDKRNMGGVLRVITLLANFFQKNGLNVTIYSLGRIDQLAFELSPSVNIIQLNHISCNVDELQNLSLFHKAVWFLKNSFLIYKFFSKTESSIWITSSQVFSLMFSLFYRKNNIIVGCDHTSTIYLSKKRMNVIRNFLLRRLNAIITLTKEDHDFYIEQKINSILIPNPINKINYSSESSENSSKNFLFVGRLSSEKDPIEAIDIFYESNLWERGYILKIYGAGNLKDEVLKYIKNMKLDNYISLIENETDINRIYKDSKALLITSKVEGLPMNMLEALSFGIPCIAYDVPYGPRNIIVDGKNGYLVQNKNRKSYISRMNDVIDRKLLSNDIYNSAKLYEISHIGNKWIELFRTLKERNK